MGGGPGLPASHDKGMGLNNYENVEGLYTEK